MIGLIRFGVLCCLLVCVFAKAKPWPNEKKFEIEILSKNQTSIQARFRQLLRVKKYFVSVSVKYLADVSSHYTTKLKKRDRQDDGYYYIDTGNELQPGTLYELVVVRLRRHRMIKTLDVFTDCDEYTYSCESLHGQRCLSPDELCDGYDDCSDQSDESKVNQTCAIKLPKRPTPPPPPPPPTNTPCMQNLTAVLALESIGGPRLGYMERPSCGRNGHYESIKCDHTVSTTCYCIHPLTGEILKAQTNFHPFVHWNFEKECEEKSQKKLGEAGNADVEDPSPGISWPLPHPPLPDGDFLPDVIPSVPPLDAIDPPFPRRN